MYFRGEDHLCFSIEGEFLICKKKQYYLYWINRKHQFQCFFWEIPSFIFRHIKNIIFWGKKTPSFLIIQERSYSSAVFLERISFSKISYFHEFFEKDYLLFSVYKIRSYFRGEKYHLSWWYKKDHIQMQFLLKDHLFGAFRKWKCGFLCSVLFWSDFWLVIVTLENVKHFNANSMIS